MIKFLNQSESGHIKSSQSISSNSKVLESTSLNTDIDKGRQSAKEQGLNSTSDSKSDADILDYEETIKLGCSSVSNGISDEVKQSLVVLDPRMWMFPITDSHQHDVVQSGPSLQLNNSDEDYSKDADQRYFSNFHSARELNMSRLNIVAGWNTPKRNKVLYFSWRLFGHLQTQMVQGGGCDWKHLGSILHRHENTKAHMTFTFQWLTLENALQHGKTIDQENERLTREFKNIHLICLRD
ncbi:Zinc finger MYM-type protein 5 [Eumeta japonica]|uniref:Zinc finger MYM-type protein 5 n=1 Tax=Eumeta variegata TaxID=151549 RepID=A0A4C1V862_EUMVA|nr:Zinc finger MYM-type protein 5 [Eumeta japonica]